MMAGRLVGATVGVLVAVGIGLSLWPEAPGLAITSVVVGAGWLGAACGALIGSRS